MASLLHAHKISVLIVLGRQDPIITAKSMSKFFNKLPDARLQLVEARHTGVIGAAAAVLQKFS